MSTQDQELRLRLLLSRQDGIVSLDQALDHGLSREAVRRRVASKQWFRVGHRVYQDASHQPTDRALVRAAVLSLGKEAVLVGEAAAWWWDLLDGRPRTFEIAVGPRQQRARDHTTLVRRTVPTRDRTTRRGVRVTTPVPTVLDAAASIGVPRGARLFDEALSRHVVTLEDLRHGYLRRSGRRGQPVLDRLMALAAGGAVSEAERLTHHQLRLAAIVGWVANLPIDVPGYGRAVADIAFPACKVIVEIDGWAFHRGLRAFLVDGPRQTALAAAGWVIVRTHWHELTTSPEVFVANLRRVLAARSTSV